jgi:hypothetical protein
MREMIYIIAAMLASWRLTEIMTVDRISDPIRRRLPWYVLQCTRCMSVWTGIACGLIYLYRPVVNIPMALAETYLLASIALNQNKDKRQSVRVLQDGNGIRIESDFDADMTKRMLSGAVITSRQQRVS